MRQQFVRWGNSLARRATNAYAKDLNVTDGSEAELSIENGRLAAAPVPPTPVYDLDELLAGITDENIHAEVSTGAAVGEESA
ncbi:AbrB/MazE/SpoVT family DNA-binding domain-containing protein [Azospirillum tabaci]|uniref:AbrB/MazE/SpoVT family DNA-binding domain-containing protein n=1 Tax=Azospirillum tabaci TaxID=2752310 RepID=UPI00166051B6|nr:AbrB/MazE/SpoVT family DNA-binding domain-containing protein [Azospirillum tabaci]